MARSSSVLTWHVRMLSVYDEERMYPCGLPLSTNDGNLQDTLQTWTFRQALVKKNLLPVYRCFLSSPPCGKWYGGYRAVASLQVTYKLVILTGYNCSVCLCERQNRKCDKEAKRNQRSKSWKCKRSKGRNGQIRNVFAALCFPQIWVLGDCPCK